MSLSIARAISEGATALGTAGVADARREAGSLLAHTIGRDRSYIITHKDDPLTNEQVEAYFVFVARRAGGEPLQYITGHQEFFKLDFEIMPDVLIPRPETELLVEIALAILKDIPEPLIADIGTGSGCIAISLLHELTRARALATDISPAALEVARRNAQRHGVLDRMMLVQSDCFSNLDAQQTFSLILSNPPYIADRDLETLQREVRKHEPQAALKGGEDGLSVIRRLLLEASRFLRSGGTLVFEIGFGQSEAVKQLIEPHAWNLIEIRQDLQGIPRAVILERKGTVGSG
jgi:release factor glutamine methyltransferase